MGAEKKGLVRLTAQMYLAGAPSRKTVLDTFNASMVDSDLRNVVRQSCARRQELKQGIGKEKL